MKRLGSGVSLTIWVFVVISLAQTKSGAAEQELINLENEWAEAWRKRDVAFFERIEADDYTWTSHLGEV